jgi:glycosyltransferase involved in cell wall biosynthesis
VVTTSYPRFPGDPAGGFVAAHVAALRALGHDVEVIAAGDVDRASIDPQVTRIPSNLFYRGGAPDALERDLAAYRDAATFTTRLVAAVARRARHWDLAVAHWLAPSALAALPTRVPLLAIAHGGDVHTLARLRLLGPMLQLLRARNAQLAFVSAELKQLAQRHGPVAGAIVQPMGVDVAHFAGLGRTPTSPPTVLVVARLVPIKGVDVAIDAMRHVAAPARLVIAGDGPERAALATRSSIELLGAVDTARRDQLLREASLVVIPSRVLPNGRTEGMPTIALEALAAGVPVVASAVGGLRELAAATLVPPDDPRALASSIDAVIANPPRIDLQASVRQLDWPVVANRLLAHAAPRSSRRDA